MKKIKLFAATLLLAGVVNGCTLGALAVTLPYVMAAIGGAAVGTTVVKTGLEQGWITPYPEPTPEEEAMKSAFD